MEPVQLVCCMMSKCDQGHAPSGCIDLGGLRSTNDLRAIIIRDNDTSLTRKYAGVQRWRRSEIETVAIVQIFRPFFIAPEVLQAGFDFDNMDRPVPRQPDNIGAPAVTQGQFANRSNIAGPQ